jgi:hypothetical protein
MGSVVLWLITQVMNQTTKREIQLGAGIIGGAKLE